MEYKSGKNVSDLVRIALLGLEKDISTVFEHGKKEGNQQGYTKGKKDWAICVYMFYMQKGIRY